jgi:hypothetical protein
MEDNTGEWISFKSESVMVANEVVLARLSTHACVWPAISFWESHSATPLVQTFKSFKKQCMYEFRRFDFNGLSL